MKFRLILKEILKALLQSERKLSQIKDQKYREENSKESDQYMGKTKRILSYYIKQH